MPKQQRKWYTLLFGAYCLLMLWLLFGQRVGQGAGSINLKPFETLRLFWRVLRHSQQPGQIRHAVINLGGNVAMFVPLGFLVPCIWEKMGRFWRHFLVMTAIIVAVELLQLMAELGTCDVDDLLLNLAGTTMGFGFYKLWKRLLQSNSRGGS